MQTSSVVRLPLPPKTTDPELRAYFSALHRALTEAFRNVYVDLSQGRATLTTVTSAPAAAEVDQSQVVLRRDAGNEALYVNVAGAIKSVALS